MSDIEHRYEASPAWHVIDTAAPLDFRDMAAASSAEDAERIVRALNSAEGAVSALRDLRDRSIDLAALIGPQNSAVFAGWMRAVDAAQRHLGGR